MGTNEVRQTHLEVLNSITITSLGAEIDPGANSIFGWSIYASNNTNNIISTVFSQTGISFTDIGLSTYDTVVSIDLSPGFYLFELHNSVDPSSMARYNEGNQGLPFLTSDSNFRVLNGCGSGSGVGSVACANTILPAFTVSTTTTTTVPEPSILFLMLAGGIVGIGFTRKRREPRR